MSQTQPQVHQILLMLGISLTYASALDWEKVLFVKAHVITVGPMYLWVYI